MKRIDFNTGWTCRALKPGAEAIPVTLPHDAMRTEARVNTSLGEANIGWFEGGDYEYRKLFTPEAELRDYVQAHVVETRREDFPLYTPKQRRFGIFTIRKEGSL